MNEPQKQRVRANTVRQDVRQVLPSPPSSPLRHRQVITAEIRQLTSQSCCSKQRHPFLSSDDDEDRCSPIDCNSCHPLATSGDSQALLITGTPEDGSRHQKEPPSHCRKLLPAHINCGPSRSNRSLQQMFRESNVLEPLEAMRCVTDSPKRPAAATTAVNSSENWGMVRRFGFPCSSTAYVCDAEHEAMKALEAAAEECEARWAHAFRGVPLLANATPETTEAMRRLCRKYGVPNHLRAIVWLTLTGVALKMDENLRMCSVLLSRHGRVTGEPCCTIEKDLERTFPYHPYFSPHDVGLPKLERVLHAICWRYPLLNYCQSFNFLAATFLLITDDEEATFWLMCFLLEDLLPNDYYGDNLIGLKVDQEVILVLLDQCLPRLARHFNDIRFDVRALVPAWIMSLFVNTFPFETVVRIWDVMLTNTSYSTQPGSGGVGGVQALSSLSGGIGVAGASYAMFGSGRRTPIPITIILGFLKLHHDDLLAMDDSGEVLHELTQRASVCYHADVLIKFALSMQLSGYTLHTLRRQQKVILVEEALRRRDGEVSRDARHATSLGAVSRDDDQGGGDDSDDNGYSCSPTHVDVASSAHSRGEEIEMEDRSGYPSQCDSLNSTT